MTATATRIKSAFAPENRRRTAFFAALVLAIAPYALVSDFLPAVVLGWVGAADFAHHQIHDMAFAGFLWLGLLGLLVQFYRPESKTSVMVAVALAWVIVAIVTVAASGFDAFVAIFLVPLAVATFLHPAGRDLLRVDTARFSPLLAGLAIVAAVPLLAFAADQFANQMTLADDHAAFNHWSGMAAISVGILALGTLASLRQRGYRTVGWLTGVFAVYFGTLSLAFPTVTASNVGTMWGVAAVIWGVAFVVGTEWDVRHEETTETVRSPDAGRPA